MKTFIFDTFNRYKRFSNTLDIKTILCNKTWWVFNDTGEKEIFIFQDDGSIIISVNGIVTNADWKYVPVNKSVVISTQKQKVMLKPYFVDDFIFSLQLDGTNNYVFLIDEANRDSFQPKSLSDIGDYFKKEELATKKLNEQQNKAEKERKEIELREIEKEQFEIRKNALIQAKTSEILAEDKYYNLLIYKYEKLEKIKKEYYKFILIFLISLFILIVMGLSIFTSDYSFPLPERVGFICGLTITIGFLLAFSTLIPYAIIDSKISRTQEEYWRYEKDISEKVRTMY